MTPSQIKLLIAAVVVALAALGGWTARGWKEGEKYQAMVADIESQKVAALEKAAEETKSWKDRVAEIDSKRTLENRNAQVKIDDLKRRLRDGTIVLSVPSGSTCGVPGNSGDPGVGNGAERTELNGSTSVDLVSVTDDGDEAIRQLNTCQDILSVLQRTAINVQ